MAPESAEAPATRGEEAPEGSRGPEPELFVFGSTGPAAPGSPSRSPRKRSGGNRPWADFEAQAAEAARKNGFDLADLKIKSVLGTDSKEETHVIHF